MMRKISVIFTTFNEKEDYLIKSINSILQQSFENFELIIVVEPNDKNIELLQKISSIDQRILLIINQTKQGFVKSLNIGLKYASGEYIARMDSDDFCDLSRFQKQIDFFGQNQDIDVLGSDIELVDRNDKIVGYRQYQNLHSKIVHKFLFSNAMAHPTVMMKKKCLDEFGYYNEQFNFSEDLEMWLRFITNGCKFANLQEPLVHYRVSSLAEERPIGNWQFNFKARVFYSMKIWNPIYAVISILMFYGIQKIPQRLLASLLRLKLINKIKGKNI